MSTKVQLLDHSDIFDLYGCEYILRACQPDDDDKRMLSFRLREIQELYVTSVKARIRAEARFCGVTLDQELTLSDMLNKARSILEASLNKSFQSGFGGINLMAEVLKAHRTAGVDLGGINVSKYGLSDDADVMPAAPAHEVDPNWFRSHSTDEPKSRMFDNPKWAEISEAYLKIEQANSDDAIISSIDLLNSLQHNSFHVLIDLQSGRMLENSSVGQVSHGEARANLQEVLNIKYESKSPYEFVKSMSKDIQKIMQRYKASAPHGK